MKTKNEVDQLLAQVKESVAINTRCEYIVFQYGQWALDWEADRVDYLHPSMNEGEFAVMKNFIQKNKDNMYMFRSDWLDGEMVWFFIAPIHVTDGPEQVILDKLSILKMTEKYDFYESSSDEDSWDGE